MPTFCKWILAPNISYQPPWLLIIGIGAEKNHIVQSLISIQRNIKTKCCKPWQLHITTVCDQTLSSKMTTLTPTEQGLSETSTRMWEWRGWNGLPVLLTSTSLNTCEISLSMPFMPEWPTQPWLVTNASWRMGCHPKALCNWAGEQNEEEVSGCYGRVQFFHMQYG